MNKKPVLFRLICTVIVIAVFAMSIYPLKPLNFYATLRSLASPQVSKTLPKDKKKEVKKEMLKKLDKTIKLAEELEKKENILPSVAIQRAADKLGTDLTKYIVVKNARGNKDVISFVKMKAASSIRLGIDLNGGVEFLLKLVPTDDVKNAKGETVKQDFDKQRDAAIEVLRQRLESENIFESEISPVGDKYVSLKVPTTSKDEIEAIKNILTMSARLEFRKVHPENSRLVAEYLRDPKNFKTPPGYTMLIMDKSDSKQEMSARICFVKNRIAMRGKNNIASAGPRYDQYGQRMISITFTSAGSQRFAELTKQLAPKTKAGRGEQLAIVLDGKLYSAPVVNEPITGGQAQITGSFSQEEVKNISTALMSGNLPKVKIEAMFETDPTLGKQSVKTGTYAGIVGLLLVIAFMCIYYMMAGLIASIAVLINIVLIMGFMSTFQATLTLPGIAGIVLTIGMAVDANVLIFERIREELNKGKNLLTAIDLGYSRAFITIFDANVTTLFVALILMWLGSGPVKGFAVTLAIGIVTSMFTALFVTRLIFDIILRYIPMKGLPMLQIFRKPNFDFLGKKNFAITCSAVMIVISLATMIYKGSDCLGIDFKGGTRITYNYTLTQNAPRPNIDDIQKLLKTNGYDSKVSYKQSLLNSNAEEKLEVVLANKNASETKGTGSLKADVRSLINLKYPNFKLTAGSETSLGGLIGERFMWSAITAIIIAIIGIIIYISVRFEFTFAIASIIALVHDISIATGLFLLSGYFLPGSSGELSLPVIAALLTILGYSLNDTIVVFDRIREGLSLIKDKSYKEIINISINQTLSRTVLTSATTMIVLLALYVVGVASIMDFVLVMIIGVVVGTYSSIFIASPIVAVWHKRIGKNVK